MTSPTLRVVLRAAAIAIAIAALIDPAFSSTRPVDRRLVAIVASHASDSVDRLRAAADGWDVITRSAGGPSLPCAPGERCVLIADGSIDVDVPGDLAEPVSLIVEKASGDANVEVRRVIVSSAYTTAAGTARVDLLRTGAIASTDIRITDGGAVVGSATHKWTEGPSASVEVPWWPIQAGARMLGVEAITAPGEVFASDNRVDVGVDVTSARSSVLVFDARPSWISTFVRRALEDDARFTVGHRARVAPSLTSGTAGSRLDGAVLDQIALLVIGGPDALTASDASLIETFVRVRGGTLVLLPEQRTAGAAEKLFLGTWTEHLSSTPERVGALYATEILRAGDEPLATVIAQSGSKPAIVSMPAGNGRIIISGAMDAWRHRDKDANAFDRFWRSLVAEGAAAGAPLSATFDRTLTARGARTRFTIHDRRMTPITSVEGNAIVRCGDQAASVVRLRPTGVMGDFSGEAAVGESGACAIEMSVDGRQLTAGFAVADHPNRGTNATLNKLVNAVSRTSGIVINSGEEAGMIDMLERDARPSSQVVSARPMRSPWWMIPFALCLTAEWWLRRRDGLR